MKRFFHLVFLIALALVIIYPAAKPLFHAEFYQVHDYTHVARLAEMDLAIKDGHFPVRWSKNFGFGYGMPLFNFYGPTPFYLGEVFHVAGFGFITSIKMVIYLSFLGSFLGMYLLAREYWGALGALVSATAVTYAPYRAVDAYVRGSINELFGITFTILALAFLIKWIRSGHIGWFVAGAFSLFGLITSHNVTALMAIPAIMIFALVEILNHKSRFLNLAMGMMAMIILGIGLSATYSLPAFAEKNNTSISSITTGYFDFHQHFLYLRQFLNSPWGFGGSIYGLEDGLSFEVGKIHLLLAIMTVLLFLPAFKKLPQLKNVLLISGVIIAGSMLMTTFKTQFIWEHIPLLSFIQFPWRFLSLIIIFISLLAGGSIMVLSRLKINQIPLTLTCILLLTVYNQTYFKPEKYTEHAEDLYYSDPAKIQSKMSNTLPDYIPPGVSQKLPPSPGRFFLESDGQVTPLSPTINRT